MTAGHIPLCFKNIVFKNSESRLSENFSIQNCYVFSNHVMTSSQCDLLIICKCGIDDG